MKALKSQLASELLADPKARDQLREFMTSKRSTPQTSHRSAVGGEFAIRRTDGLAVLATIVPKPRLPSQACDECSATRTHRFFSVTPRFHLPYQAQTRRADIAGFFAVRPGKEAVLYVPVLDEFYVDAEGQLDRLVLQGVARRPTSADKPPDAPDPGTAELRFYSVDGDSFVLRYAETKTLNIQYVRLTRDA